ncbi:MAG TPA: addiction module protein [Acidobacteriaceae bacterium]|jgi:hypothetical protein|nr:addiction module protein [Acidobacteriaceae bacterium]
MTRTAAELLEEARQLPAHMQYWLAQELLETEESESPAEIEAAWEQEIKRRLDEIDSGAVEMIPGEVVVERMFSRIAAARLKK